MLRIPFVYDADAVSAASSLETGDDSRTQQAPRDEVDINSIVRSFGLGYQVPEVPLFTNSDFSEVVDFHTAMSLLRDAQESFSVLPADLRARFENDPGLFVDYCSDERNRESLFQNGLLKPGFKLNSTGADPGAAGEDSSGGDKRSASVVAQ